MCTDYQLPDVSQFANFSSLIILSGPASFDVHLDKAGKILTSAWFG
jgi:hypothetical protein